VKVSNVNVYAAGSCDVGRAISCVCEFVCLSVRAVKGKRLELSTLKSVDV